MFYNRTRENLQGYPLSFPISIFNLTLVKSVNGLLQLIMLIPSSPADTSKPRLKQFQVLLIITGILNNYT